ncbi:MAG TPA: HisA/HisF-related TIM barrel protein [Methanoregula sp.]|nr:HisA/HisF-related TIM barrel protein [Methanoregula sp.]
MELVLAMDLRHNLVVHGKKGERTSYKPLDRGLSPTADPPGFIAAIRPKFIYIADLDRIEGTGSHDDIVVRCARAVERCYVDRGCRSPSDMLEGEHITNIVGTETGGADLGSYRGGLLSVDMKDGKVIPSGGDPAGVLAAASSWDFEGCILLNISSVGTGSGVDAGWLRKMRSAYDKKLFYGGGVATVSDLETLSACGFDGAIIATALHKGAVPLGWVRRGRCC